MSRGVLSVVLQAALATLLTIVLGGLYFLLLIGMPPAEAFLDRAVRLVLLFVDIGIVTWVALLVVGAVRRKGLGWGVGGSLLAALVGAVVNLIWVVILSVINGGADMFALALGVRAGLFFLVAVAVTAPVVVRVVLRRESPETSSH